MCIAGQRISQTITSPGPSFMIILSNVRTNPGLILEASSRRTSDGFPEKDDDVVDWVLLADRVVAFVLAAEPRHRSVEIVVVKIAVNFHRHSLLRLRAWAVTFIRRRRTGF